MFALPALLVLNAQPKQEGCSYLEVQRPTPSQLVLMLTCPWSRGAHISLQECKVHPFPNPSVPTCTNPAAIPNQAQGLQWWWGGVSAVLPQGQEGPEKVLEIQQHPKALVTSCALTSPALDVQPLYRVSGSV